MKKTLAMIFLAVLTVGLLGSCTKNIEERLDKDEATLAELNAAIGQYEGLSGDITSVIEALRAEVGTRPASEQQSVWNCIAALQNQKGTFDAAIAALNALVGEKSVSVQIDEATSKLIEEYQLDGLASSIQSIKDKLSEKTGISALSDQVSALQGKVDVIAWALSKISDYEAMIQSVRINPASADGCVTAERGILTFTFTVTPATALDGVRNLKGCLKLYANEVEVKTKSGVFAEIPATSAEIIDPEKGEVTVEANVTDYLPAEKTSTLSVALNVKTGVSNYTTEFVTVSNYIPDYLPGFFTVNDNGRQVRFSKGNLWYDGSKFNFEANQYDVQTSWSPSHVSHFFWSKDASVACAASYSESGTAQTDVFFTNDPTDAEKAKADFTVNGVSGKYRTLSKDEFNYLFSRTSRHGFATVGGVYGIIILPDTFTDPMKNGGSGAFKPLPTQEYDANVYTIGGNWEAMESAGAVFLPATNFRKGTNFDQYSSGSGFYWSSIVRSANKVYGVTFNNGTVYPQTSDHGREYGKSVRLVADVK